MAISKEELRKRREKELEKWEKGYKGSRDAKEKLKGTKKHQLLKKLILKRKAKKNTERMLKARYKADILDSGIMALESPYGMGGEHDVKDTVKRVSEMKKLKAYGGKK